MRRFGPLEVNDGVANARGGNQDGPIIARPVRFVC